MKRLFYILVFIPMFSFGQNVKSVDYTILASEYFPLKSFSQNKDEDLSSRTYWANFLHNFKKKSVYRDTAFREYYRLLHFGSTHSVVEIIKTDDDYILSVSEVKNNTLYVTIDSISIKAFKAQSDSIDYFVDKMWSLKSIDKKREICEDDRDTWVLEIKKGGKYHVIERIEAETSIRQFIAYIMKIAGLREYTIYRKEKKQLPPTHGIVNKRVKW